LTKASGQSTWQFANEALAKPLGFTLAQWPRDPQGVYFGGNDMLMTPRQLLMLGQTYLTKGASTASRWCRRDGSSARAMGGPCTAPVER
jgi:CubicO group peptidase (beta-lactamase class C family)